MPTRCTFFQTSEAGFTRETNEWTLVADASGELIVEHQWSYIDPFGDGGQDGETSNVSVDSFLSGSADDLIKEKLRSALATSREI